MMTMMTMMTMMVMMTMVMTMILMAMTMTMTMTLMMMMMMLPTHVNDDIRKQYLNVAIPPKVVDDHANNPCNTIDDNDDRNINLAWSSLPPGNVNA
jgi:hypothetical protein